MKRFLTGAAVLTLALWAPTLVRAADKVDDKDFLVRSIECNTKEVRLSELADSRSENQKVKDFARTMIQDHKALHEAMAEKAKVLKVAVVGGTERDTRDAVDRLSKLKGADFDREYVKMMVEDHQKAVELHESYSKAATSDELSKCCKDALPKIKAHLEAAKKLQSDLK